MRLLLLLLALIWVPRCSGQGTLFYNFETPCPNASHCMYPVTLQAISGWNIEGSGGSLGIGPYSGSKYLSTAGGFFSIDRRFQEASGYIYLQTVSFFFQIPNTLQNASSPITLQIRPPGIPYSDATIIPVPELGRWYRYSGKTHTDYGFTLEAYQVLPGTSFAQHLDFGIDDFSVTYVGVPEPSSLVIGLLISFCLINRARKA